METPPQNQIDSMNNKEDLSEVFTSNCESCFIISETCTISEDAFNALESNIDNELVTSLSGETDPSQCKVKKQNNICTSASTITAVKNLSSAASKNTEANAICATEHSKVQRVENVTNISSNSSVNIKTTESCTQRLLHNSNPPVQNKSISQKLTTAQPRNVPIKNSVVKNTNNSSFGPTKSPRTHPIPLLSLPYAKPVVSVNKGQSNAQSTGLLPTPLLPSHKPLISTNIPEPLFPTQEYRPRPCIENFPHLQTFKEHPTAPLLSLPHHKQWQQNYYPVRNDRKALLPNTVNVPMYNKPPMLPMPNLNYNVPQQSSNISHFHNETNNSFMNNSLLQIPVNTKSKLCAPQKYHCKSYSLNPINVSSYNTQRPNYKETHQQNIHTNFNSEPLRKKPLLEVPESENMNVPFQSYQSKQSGNRQLTREEYNQYCYNLHMSEQELVPEKLDQRNVFQQAKYESRGHPSSNPTHATGNAQSNCKETRKQNVNFNSGPLKKKPLLETPAKTSTVDLNVPFQSYCYKQLFENRPFTREEYNQYCYNLHMNEQELVPEKLDQVKQSKHPSMAQKYKHINEEENSSCDSDIIVLHEHGTLPSSSCSSDPINHIEWPHKNIPCPRKRTLTSSKINEIFLSKLDSQFPKKPRLLHYDEETTEIKATVVQAKLNDESTSQLYQGHQLSEQVTSSRLGDLIRGQDYQRRSDIPE